MILNLRHQTALLLYARSMIHHKCNTLFIHLFIHFFRIHLTFHPHCPKTNYRMTCADLSGTIKCFRVATIYGTKVAILVGTKVTTIDGIKVATIDGIKVATIVGIKVAICVGTIVGISDGTKVAISVGTKV